MFFGRLDNQKNESLSSPQMAVVMGNPRVERDRKGVNP
jgi:hypothetical protein